MMLVSVVTPSYNQAAFLAQALDSIVEQEGANVESVVMDGGSNDGSVQILEHYSSRLAYWQSQPDGGQTSALNAGFSKAKGELMGWQNSDDYYYPGALAAAAAAAEAHPDVDVFYGDKDYVDESGNFLFTAWAKDPHDFANMIPWPCVHSEVLLFRRRTWDEGFRLNEERRHYMDYEFFWDLLLAGKRFLHVPGIRAAFRQHPEAKTSRQAEIAQREAFEIYLKVWGRGQLNAVARGKMIEALRNECINDFSASRMVQFRRHCDQLVVSVGSGAWTPSLRIRYLLSYFSRSGVRLAMRVVNLCRSRVF